MIAFEQEVIVYSQIVVPHDGGDFAHRACQPALQLAERSDAALLLIGCAPSESRRQELESDLAARAAALKEMTSAPVGYRVVVSDHPAAGIVAEVDAEPGSLVCMSSVGRARTEPLLGSVAEAVLRDVSTPALLVGPSVDVDHFALSGAIEVPVDGSRHAESILPIAASWSIVYRLGLRVVTVAPGPTRMFDPLESWMETGYVRNVAERLRRDVDRSVDFDVLHGNDVVERIVDDAARYTSVIALATHGRTGRSRVAAGSVAMGVVHRATVPVLAYRPLELRPVK
jgi:nucleotide-binding universal stress UspA family protein